MGWRVDGVSTYTQLNIEEMFDRYLGGFNGVLGFNVNVEGFM